MPKIINDLGRRAEPFFRNKDFRARVDTRGTIRRNSKPDDMHETVEEKISNRGASAKRLFSIHFDQNGKSLSGVMGHNFKKFLLAATGPFGASVVSLITLFAVLTATTGFQQSLWQLPAALAIIRFGHWLCQPESAVLKAPSARRKIWKVLGDEILIVLLLLAVCNLMQWTTDRFSVLVFFVANLVLQAGLMQIRRSVFKYLGKITQGQQDYKCTKQAIIVGTGKRAKELADMILDSPEMETFLIGFLDYDRKKLWRYRDIPLMGHPEDFEKIAAVSPLDSLVIAVEPEDLGKTQSVFSSAEEMGVPVCLMPDIFRPHFSKTSVVHLNGFPALSYHAVPEGKLSLLLKSGIDRVGALVGIILAAPIMLVTALAIKLDSKGPILFRQVRSGLNGKRFEFLKFRTMCNDAEEKKKELLKENEMSGPVFKIQNGPRVTRVGRILRRFSIDELPQFFNVLIGDMSLVGPRPALPSEVAKYEPWQHRKLSVKPGVTCIWQVSGRNNVDFEEWMRLDLQYIDNWSLWQDTKILVRTIPAVLKGEGAS